MPFSRLIGIFPLGVGVTVLGGLWLAPFGAFHSPPLFFRIFGSFIAIPFVMFGAAIVSGKMEPGKRVSNLLKHARGEQENSLPQETPDGDGYQCPGCGAPLADDAGVSPLGDVKCEHCNRWFNIHGRQS